MTIEITPKGAAKVIGGIIATIVLGAIGSGLWERVLSPATNWIYRESVNLVSNISIGYKDGIYEAASQGFHEAYSLKIFAVSGLLLSLFFMITAELRLGRVLKIDSIITEIANEKWIARLIVIASLSFSLFMFISVNKHEAINKTLTYSTRSLDILRPHIGDEVYFKMLSEFYQIKTASQFYSFNRALITLSTSKSVVFPVFSPL